MALALLVVAGPAPAVASFTPPIAPAGTMVEGPRSRPPLGYLRYCRRHPIDCRQLVMPALGAGDGELSEAARPVALTASRWDELVAVNRRVNAMIRPRADRAVHRTADVWSLAPVAGDCEDYALTKRRALQTLGWPARSLLIAIARDHRDRQHAVLVARTDHGDLVLDNLRDQVVPWTTPNYRWIKRQSIENPRDWVRLDANRAKATRRGSVGTLAD